MCRLKFQKQMIQSEQSGWISTRELKEEALRNDWTVFFLFGQLKPTGEGAGLQIPGWIIQLAR